MKVNQTNSTSFGRIYVDPSVSGVLNQKLSKVQYAQFRDLLGKQLNNPVDVMLGSNKNDFFAQVKINKNGYNCDELYIEKKQDTNLLKMIRNACKRADEICADFLKFKIKKSLLKK